MTWHAEEQCAHTAMTCGDRSCSRKRFTATSVLRQVPRNTSPKLPMPILGPSVISSASISHSALLSAQPSQRVCLCSSYGKHEDARHVMSIKLSCCCQPLMHQVMVIIVSSRPIQTPITHS